MGLFGRFGRKGAEAQPKHEWEHGICRKCGAICEHPSTHTVTYDWGEWDYSSYGGSVNPVIVHVEVCDVCGYVLGGYATGDFCGSQEELDDMVREFIDRQRQEVHMGGSCK